MQSTRESLELQHAFYETIRQELEADSFGKWAVVSNERLVGVYESNRAASEIALKLTADGACLVKRVGYIVNVEPSMVRLKHAPLSNP